VALLAFGGANLAMLLTAASLAGFGVVGAQIGCNALAAAVYPTAVRATGVGWALGVGRLGAIIGPLVGGALLGIGWTAKAIILTAVGPAPDCVGGDIHAWPCPPDLGDENLILHGFFRSTASWRVRIALGLKGLSAEQVSLTLRDGHQRRPDYLALNPQGLVPALTLDNGVVLTQSLAICEYLDETYLTPPLLPWAAPRSAPWRRSSPATFTRSRT
jgi:MFS family permease